MKLLLSLFAAAGLSVFAGACSQEKQVEYKEDGTPVTSETPGPARRTFPYNALLTNKNALGLSLADATAFSMTLSDCVSTQSATVTEANVYLEMYEFDRNCLVTLTQFTLNGKVYVPKAGSEFTTWAVGNKAVFEVAAANPADELGVEVISTVANPVVAGGTIHYQFSEITQGSDVTIGESVVRESQVLTVNGQAAPDLTVNQVTLVNITADGNGEFQFQMECNGSDVVGAGASMRCHDVLLNDIYMVLVEDTYGGTLTLQNLTDIYTNAGGGKQVDTSGAEIFAAGGGSPALPHGGFITAATGDADVMVMAGVKPIVQHPNMLFILKAGPSFLYFNMDVTLITQDDSPL